METIRGVITRALKKLSVIRGSGQPTADQAADGLASLASLYQELITNGTCGRIHSVPIDRAFDGVAGYNQHISVVTDEAVTIELPATMPRYWCCNWRPCRDYGWGLSVPYNDGLMTPPDLSVVRVTDQFGPSRATYLYDDPIQRWLRVDDLDITVDSGVLNREAPLSARNIDGLAALLAVRIADEYGAELLQPLTVQAANRYKIALVSAYGYAKEYC